MIFGIQTNVWVFLAGMFSVVGFFVGVFLFCLAQAKRVKKEIGIYAEKIGAIVPEDIPSEEFLERFASFALMNRGRDRTAGRRVVYPSDFGDIYLFYYKYADNPKGTPNGSFRSMTVLTCDENFGVPRCCVTNSGLTKFAKKIVGIRSSNKRLELLIADKRRCNLEVSDTGIMLYFNELVFRPSVMADLIFEFSDLLQEIKDLRKVDGELRGQE